MKTHIPRPEHQEFMTALKAQIPPDMQAEEILAVVSQFVGQLVAMQDHRRYTPDTVMQMVMSNIEIGNQAAVLSIGEPQGNG